jgi:hypothetical protein
MMSERAENTEAVFRWIAIFLMLMQDGANAEEFNILAVENSMTEYISHILESFVCDQKFTMRVLGDQCRAMGGI